MYTISSGPAKRQGLRNPDLALILTLFIGILAISGIFTGSAVFLFSEPRANLNGDVSDIEGVSFASDEEYWTANCSHGWDSDSVCDAIVLRTKLCTGYVSSDYCSDYKNYLRQSFNQKSGTTAYTIDQ